MFNYAYPFPLLVRFMSAMLTNKFYLIVLLIWLSLLKELAWRAT